MCRLHAVHHHVQCRHQIEIEILPAATEVYFQDERFTDAVNTQTRFEASVFNAPTNNAHWSVTGITGGPGAGTIDPSGVYTAPPKGGILSGHTDIIVAAAVDDPMRKAYARVILVGRGPEPRPVPKLDIYPKQAYLYYRDDAGYAHIYNSYIDTSNKIQQFRAAIRNSSLTAVTWSVPAGSGEINPGGVYTAPASGTSPAYATITAVLNGTSAKNEAKIILLNYTWPGIIKP